jgi:integrase
MQTSRQSYHRRYRVTASTLLPGVRVHPNGRSTQVRVYPFPEEAGFPLDGDEANAYSLELRRRKRAGILVPPPRTSSATLADLAGEYLTRLKTVGGKRKIPYSPAGMVQAHKCCRPWLGETTPPCWVKGGGKASALQAVDEKGVPIGSLPLAMLTVRQVELYLERRSELTPRAAVGEYQALVGILRLAARRGETFDQGLLALDPVRRRPKPRKTTLTLDQLRYLAQHAPEHQRRLFLLGATLGCRIGELLQAEDAWLDADAGTLTAPAWACKERRDKILDLLPEELAVLREQRLVRSPQTVNGVGGTRLLFPRKGGTPWRTSGGFWAEVILPTRQKAAKAWRAEFDLAADAETPFDTFAPHDLRRIAATTLRQMGVDAELVARRLGHADQGQLVDQVYAADTRRERLRAELDRIASGGGIR